MQRRNVSFPLALAALLQTGAKISRPGWRNKFHLEIDCDTFSTAVVLRVADDDSGMRTPWGVITEDDSQANDWEIAETPNAAADEFTVDVGTYAYAFQSLLSGAKAIRMSAGWHPDMKVLLVDGQVTIDQTVTPIGKVMVLKLASGECRIYRPAPQDLVAAWTVMEAAA